MPPKSRSSTSKSASSAKLGFSSSKKGVAGSGKGAKGAVEPATKKVKLERKKSGLEGLYPRLYREAVRKMGPASAFPFPFDRGRRAKLTGVMGDSPS